MRRSVSSALFACLRMRTAAVKLRVKRQTPTALFFCRHGVGTPCGRRRSKQRAPLNPPSVRPCTVVCLPSSALVLVSHCACCKVQTCNAALCTLSASCSLRSVTLWCARSLCALHSALALRSDALSALCPALWSELLSALMLCVARSLRLLCVAI